jgi:predicted Fe-Mo cluster-binding NifX family protein
MKRILVPIFQERISPVFDSCTRILIIDVERGKECARDQLYLDNLTLDERIPILRRLKPSVVICGGISEELSRILDQLHIRLISGVAGNVDEVVQAFLTKKLDDPLFFMPGVRATQ